MIIAIENQADAATVGIHDSIRGINAAGEPRLSGANHRGGGRNGQQVARGLIGECGSRAGDDGVVDPVVDSPVREVAGFGIGDGVEGIGIAKRFSE